MEIDKEFIKSSLINYLKNLLKESVFSKSDISFNGFVAVNVDSFQLFIEFKSIETNNLREVIAERRNKDVMLTNDLSRIEFEKLIRMVKLGEEIKEERHFIWHKYSLQGKLIERKMLQEENELPEGIDPFVRVDSAFQKQPNSDNQNFYDEDIPNNFEQPQYENFEFEDNCGNSSENNFNDNNNFGNSFNTFTPYQDQPSEVSYSNNSPSPPFPEDSPPIPSKIHKKNNQTKTPANAKKSFNQKQEFSKNFKKKYRNRYKGYNVTMEEKVTSSSTNSHGVPQEFGYTKVTFVVPEVSSSFPSTNNKQPKSKTQTQNSLFSNAADLILAGQISTEEAVNLFNLPSQEFLKYLTARKKNFNFDSDLSHTGSENKTKNTSNINSKTKPNQKKTKINGNK